MCGLSSPQELSIPAPSWKRCSNCHPRPRHLPLTCRGAPEVKAGCDRSHPAWTRAAGGHPRLHHQSSNGVSIPWVGLFPNTPLTPLLALHRDRCPGQRTSPRWADPQGPPQSPPQSGAGHWSQWDAHSSAWSLPGAGAGWRRVIARKGGRQAVPPPSPQALLIKGSEFPSASQPAPQ